MHTFCRLCLDGLCKENRIKCPTCREITELSAKGLEGLPKNRMIANIVEKLKGENYIRNVSHYIISQ